MRTLYLDADACPVKAEAYRVAKRYGIKVAVVARFSLAVPAYALIELVEAGLKGDTAQGGTKPAKMETGLTVNVPLFVNTGDKLKIDTRSGAYLERA